MWNKPFLDLVKQTVLFRAMEGTINTFSNMRSPQKAKNMLKNKEELLQTNDEFFLEKEFSNHLTESVKSNKSSKEVFLKLVDSKNSFLTLRFNNFSV